MTGHVALIGAGPGDPDLITVRGLRHIERADVIVYDRLGTEAIIPLAPATAELIDVGKEPGNHGMKQEDITRLLKDHATAGRHVVRLKGGDPFVFGRGGEEALSLVAAGVSVEIVPGVSSAFAGPAAAGVPVTHRDVARAVTVASGHDDPASPAAVERWAALAHVPGTLVLLMAMRHLDRIVAALIANGRPADEPATVVHWAGTPRQRVLRDRLDHMAQRCVDEGVGNPSVVVIGPVADLGPQIAAGLSAGSPTLA